MCFEVLHQLSVGMIHPSRKGARCPNLRPAETGLDSGLKIGENRCRSASSTMIGGMASRHCRPSGNGLPVRRPVLKNPLCTGR